MLQSVRKPSPAECTPARQYTKNSVQLLESLSKEAVSGAAVLLLCSGAADDISQYSCRVSQELAQELDNPYSGMRNRKVRKDLTPPAAALLRTLREKGSRDLSQRPFPHTPQR